MEVYSEMVARLTKSGENIMGSLTPQKIELMHMASGVAGESGEVLDIIKKHFVYGGPLDEEKLVKEMGDVEFYMEGLRQIVGVPRDYVLKQNQKKLLERYPCGYTDQAAIDRKDAK